MKTLILVMVLVACLSGSANASDCWSCDQYVTYFQQIRGQHDAFLRQEGPMPPHPESVRRTCKSMFKCIQAVCDGNGFKAIRGHWARIAEIIGDSTPVPPPFISDNFDKRR